ncbi:MAG: hypothetical protein LBJ03_01580 [Holosporales bacterium]|jgi:hypothetical protein|nr:hypothetical protein [Holosporales bacterium]
MILWVGMAGLLMFIENVYSNESNKIFLHADNFGPNIGTRDLCMDGSMLTDVVCRNAKAGAKGKDKIYALTDEKGVMSRNLSKRK